MAAKHRSGSAVGIAGIGYYVPARTITSPEMAAWSGIEEFVFTEKIGMDRKHVAGPDEHPAGLGTQAAEQALADAGIGAEEIGIIAYGGLGSYDYNFWSPAAKIQDAIGARHAYTFEIRNGCNGGNLGLHVCRELLLGSPDREYALAVAADTLSRAVNYGDKKALSSFTFGDGAAAVVLKKDARDNRLLAYASRSDGSLADFVKVPGGGTRIPCTGPAFRQEDAFLQVTDPDALDEIFAKTYLSQYLSVIREALEKSGYTEADIDHLFTNQVKKSTTDALLAGLGLDESRTVRTMREYGHMGPVDTLFCLALARETGRIRPGDLVVMAGSAIGFTWAALVLEYQ